MKTAVIHDWLVTYAGAERVLEQMLYLYPEADVFTLFDFLPDRDRGFLLCRHIRTSFMQHLPLARKKYRHYLPLMPLAIGRFDLSAYDLILSSSHAVAKGVQKNPGQLHICYCHTPMRYAWDLREFYLKESGLDRGLVGGVVNLIVDRLQAWDMMTAKHVDYFIANSQYVADRIRRAYQRESVVIYPPVDVDSFALNFNKENCYVTASRMVPYKKMDMVVQAFSRMPDKRLIVIGDGPDFDKVKALAGKNIELLGYQEANILARYLQKARAFIFAAEEDFGIVPVEAQACGTPVIAYGKGGVLETVLDGKTGIFFHEQNADSIIAAVN